MASVENGVADPSSLSVSDNWVRNSGTPYSSSWLDTDGHGRRQTRSRVRATISLRCIVMNSYNIHPSNGAGDDPPAGYPPRQQSGHDCGLHAGNGQSCPKGALLRVRAYPQPIRKRCHELNSVGSRATVSVRFRTSLLRFVWYAAREVTKRGWRRLWSE